MAAPGLISRYARTLIHSAEAKGYGETVICDAIPIAATLLRDAQAPIDTQTFFRVSRNLKLLMADEFCGFTRSPCPIGTFEQIGSASCRARLCQYVKIPGDAVPLKKKQKNKKT